MRILHVISSLEIGGAQRLLSDLLILQREKENVALLVYEKVENDFERRVEESGVRVISLDEHSFHNPKIVCRLRKIFKGYDVVHVHLFPSLYWASLAAIGLKTRLVYTEHSTSNSRRGKWYFRPIEKFIYRRYSKIIAISEQTRRALCTWLGSNDNRFVFINNGVDVARFAAIKKTVIPKSLIMVSRFAYSKDQETVIRAMKSIDKDAILRFVGDGENLEHCKQYAIEQGMAERIQFLGARSDVAELVAESYVGIQSSNWEGFGLTAVELMSSGKPVVATDVDGLKQVVEGAGEIFHKGNESELATRVNYILENKDYYNELSKKCLKRAKEYDIHLMAEKYLDVYRVMWQ